MKKKSCCCGPQSEIEGEWEIKEIPRTYLGAEKHMEYEGLTLPHNNRCNWNRANPSQKTNKKRKKHTHCNQD